MTPGQEVCVVEAMKMQNVLRASRKGFVQAIHVEAGDTVEGGSLILELE